MKYDIETEIHKLHELCSSKILNKEYPDELFKFLTQSISIIVTLDAKTELYRYIDVLLNAIVTIKSSDIDKLETTYKAVLAKCIHQHLEKKAQEVIKAMQNVWNLLNNKNSSFLVDDNLLHVIIKYIYEIKKDYRNERTSYYSKLLQEATVRDIQAQMQGQRLEIEDQESYKIAQQITNHEI